MTPVLLGNESANIELYSKNIEACLKGVYNFTSTTYMNICTGQSYIVPNGFWDYVLGFGAVLVGIVIVITIAIMVVDTF